MAFLEAPTIYGQFDPKAKAVFACDDVQKGIRRVPDESIKLVVSSPPYNIGKDYEKRKDLTAYLGDMSGTLDELCRVLHPKGSICWEVGNFVDDGEVFPLDMFFYPEFKKRGLKLRNRIIWRFNHGLHCSKRLSGRYEVILWFTKTDNYTFNLDPIRVPSKYPGKRAYKGPKKGLPSGNPLGKNPSDLWDVIQEDWENEVWDIPNVKSNHPEKSIHPCQFPIELVQRCVLALTDEDDWVLDPYAGVASTLIGALMHGRRAIGFETQDKYVSAGIERISRYYEGRLKIRPLGKPVHQPTGREKVAQVPGEWIHGQQKEMFG